MFNNQSFFNRIDSSALEDRQRLASKPLASNGPSNLFRNAFGIISLVALLCGLSGCGAVMVAGKGIADSQGSFQASPDAVNFGPVNVGSSANNSVSLVNSSSAPVVISQLSISGNSSFSLASQVQLPLTLSAGSTTALKINYNPQSASTDSGNLVINSNSTAVPTATVSLLGQGKSNSSSSPVLSGLSCTNGSLTGAGTDACTVTLDAAAPSGGLSVALTSSNNAVAVPASITVPVNATSIGFTATVAAVSSAQSVALSASAAGTTKTFSLQLQPESAPATPTLTLSAASLTFGNVALNTPARQTLTLTSSGTAPLTISAAKLSGTGFTMPEATFPVTLNPGQTTTVTVRFDPATTGTASGQLAISSNSSAGGTATVALSGTGTETTTPTLSLSSTSLTFGNVALNTPAKQTLTLTSSGTAAVTVNTASISGAGFSTPGAAFPVTLNPGQTATLTVQFNPTAAGSASGQIAITSNSSKGGTTTVALSGTGTSTATAALSALGCSNLSITGAETDACTVTLSSAAPSGGLTVALSSGNKAVTVPATVTVPANATTAGFSATISAVSSAQSATLTATANSVSKTFGLQLNTTATSTLSVNATSISFGNVVLNTPSTQSLTLTATGSAAVTVSSAAVSGNGFSLTGAKFPMTVNPGSPATLSVQFDPTATGAATGQLTIANNSSNGSNATVSLSGTGMTHEIALNWDAPSNSSDPIAGYNVYRAVSGSSSYEVLKSGNAQTSYTDMTAQSGTTYQYYVTSVDSSGAESTPSNTATVAVP